MKVAIFTLPLHSNYGGIIQAFALQTVLKHMGHDVTVIDKDWRPKKIYWLTRYPKRIIRKFLFQKNIPVFHERLIYENYMFRTQNVLPFMNQYITRELVKNPGDIRLTEFDAILVGSDQVWRPVYTTSITHYFLDFLGSNSHIRRIAYAASFGTDEWEYTEQQTLECAKLARKFDMITVREDSGVNLCQKYLGVRATHVLDPTMLLEKEDYISIVEKENVSKSKGNLFVYMLDDNEQKQSYVQKVATELGLTPFSLLPTGKELDEGKTCPSVPTWLRGFLDADFVLTDSFHGSVFSIIFNKPFIAIGNKERGQARFDSLFRLFKLQDRLVDINNLSIDGITRSIDWSAVNAIRKEMKRQSISLLANSLK